jgi:cytoskeletal protein CcmA (bactofilin family)
MVSQTRKLRNLTMTGNGISHGGEFHRVRLTGEGTVNGDLTCERLWGIGQIDVTGDLHSEVIKVLGQLSVQGNCNAEFLHVKGTLNIGGLLNGGKIDLRLFGGCEIKEIGGGVIRVKRNGRGWVDHKSLTVATIEGDDICLEWTHAKVVRGKRVEIGPGCDIDLVEYQNDFQHSPRARVKEFRRV